jgi:hypothetical protein
MGPTANFQGSYKLLCLRTGRKITRKQFQEAPMPADVIKHVESIVTHDTQSRELLFNDCQGNPVGDEPDDNKPEGAIAGVDDYTDDTDDAQEAQEHP